MGQIRESFFEEKPLSWESLESLYEYGKAGGTPRTTCKEYYSGNIPFLSISDITEQGKYIVKCSQEISAKGLQASSSWIVPKNSLIVSMYASVGLPTINKIPLATSQAMFSMIFRDQQLTEYVYQFFLYQRNREIKQKLNTGTQSNINANLIKSLMIPIYSNPVTCYFLKFESIMEKAELSCSEELKSLLKLKQSLLSQLL